VNWPVNRPIIGILGDPGGRDMRTISRGAFACCLGARFWNRFVLDKSIVILFLMPGSSPETLFCIEFVPGLGGFCLDHADPIGRIMSAILSYFTFNRCQEKVKIAQLTAVLLFSVRIWSSVILSTDQNIVPRP
jgi:hypothetical protein